jgi:hypothetical protein
LFLNDQAEILRELLEFYYPNEAKVKVIDLTFGKGALWGKILTDPALRWKYSLTACDGAPAEPAVIKRNLLTDDYSSLGSHDAAVFDPPYLIGRVSFDYRQFSRRSWAVDQSRGKFTSNESLELFNERVMRLRDKAPTFLRPGGLLLVKIMDPRKDGHLIPHHVNITNILQVTGTFELVDLSVYIRMGAATWKIAKHLQNLHGYWMVFDFKGLA